MRWLAVLLAVQVLLGGALIALVLTDSLPFVEDEKERHGPAGLDADRFDSAAAYRLVRRQVRYGPRPAGSPASHRLAAELRRLLPGGRFQQVPGGLRNVVGYVRGRQPRRLVVVGAHYDTKELAGFVGANDGAAGTAVVTELARTLRPGELRPSVAFVLFDGEESPPGTPPGQFERRGLRGSKVAAASLPRPESMVLLDFVGERELRIPREQLSDPGLWARLRRAADRVGAGEVFSPQTRPPILDDHLPFLRREVPAIDLIDFDYPCFHRRCDDLSQISERSLDLVGESVYELLRSL